MEDRGRNRGSILGWITAFGLGGYAGYRFCDFVREEPIISEEAYSRMKAEKDLLVQMLLNIGKGHTISNELIKRGIQSVAIYGAGAMGEVLFGQLANTEIRVKYFIDRDADNVKEYEKIPVKRIDEIADSSPVDAIVVTLNFDYDVIRTNLTKTGVGAEVLSLEEIVFDFK